MELDGAKAEDTLVNLPDMVPILGQTGLDKERRACMDQKHWAAVSSRAFTMQWALS